MVEEVPAWVKAFGAITGAVALLTMAFTVGHNYGKLQDASDAVRSFQGMSIDMAVLVEKMDAATRDREAMKNDIKKIRETLEAFQKQSKP